VFTDPHEIEMVWLIRESGLGATAFAPGEPPTWEGWEDAAVPPEKLGAYLRSFRSLLDRYGYHGSLYGHFGQGCVHTRTNFDLQTPDGIAMLFGHIDWWASVASQTPRLVNALSSFTPLAAPLQ
jgi:FAD/FMN-containing dehydrogenase